MLLPFALLGILAAPPLGPAAPQSTVVAYDPVEACFGRHVAGSPEWTRTRGRFEYRFASEEALGIFDAEPERYAVQLGGACARMGPLTVTGDPERYTVYRGRLYFFGSDGCRNRFLERPGAYLWSPDPEPSPSAEAVRAGRLLVTKALDAMGDKEAFVGLRSLSWTDGEFLGEGEGSERPGRTLHFDFAGSLDVVRTAGDWKQTVHVRGDRGVVVEGGEVYPLDPSERLAALRELHGEPVWLLAQRNDPAFRFWAETTAGGAEVLACHAGGVTTRLELDSAGRVVATLQRRRDPSVGFVAIRTELSGVTTTGDLRLQPERRAMASGRPVQALRRTWMILTVNEPLPIPPEAPER